MVRIYNNSKQPVFQVAFQNLLPFAFYEGSTACKHGLVMAVPATLSIGTVGCARRRAH